MFCKTCKKKPTCKKLCKRLKKHLKKLEHYQRELTFPTNKLDYLIPKSRGRRVLPSIYNDNSELEEPT